MRKSTIGKIPVSLPEFISEFTLGQYATLKAGGLTELQQLGIITTGNPEAFADLKRNDDIDLQIDNAFKLTSHLVVSVKEFRLSNEKVTPPKEVLLAGLTISIPKDVKSEPYGAYVYCKAMFTAIANDVSKADEYILDILAHYLYRPYMRKLINSDEQYNQYKAEEFKEVVKDLPLDIAQRLYCFFLLKSNLLYKTKLQCYRVALTLWLRQLAFRISTSSVTLTY